MKKAKPDVISDQLIDRKHSLNASLDAAVSEWKGSEAKPESWFAKGNFQLYCKPVTCRVQSERAMASDRIFDRVDNSFRCSSNMHETKHATNTLKLLFKLIKFCLTSIVRHDDIAISTAWLTFVDQPCRACGLPNDDFWGPVVGYVHNDSVQQALQCPLGILYNYRIYGNGPETCSI